MLNDNDFITNCNVPGPTKEAIRAIILYKAEIKKTDTVVDIGCGTGGLSCEFAQRAQKVIAIDHNPQATQLTQKNLEKFKIKGNIEIKTENAINTLKKIEKIDIGFIGGSGKELNQILDILNKKLNPQGKIIITAILIDTKLEAINKLKKLGYQPQITEAHISNGKILDRGIMMISENPIAIITAQKKNNYTKNG